MPDLKARVCSACGASMIELPPIIDRACEALGVEIKRVAEWEIVAEEDRTLVKIRLRSDNIVNSVVLAPEASDGS